MRHQGLAARIARLEARVRPGRLPRMTFMLHPDDAPKDAVQGFRSHDGTITAREPGEAAAALLARAWAHPNAGPALFAIYPQNPSPAHELEWPEVVRQPTKPEPFAKAGIGRVATRAELERMGVARIPPERLM